MSAATPAGCLTVMSRLEDTGDGMVSPYCRRASSANHSKKDAANPTSPAASANGLPCGGKGGDRKKKVKKRNKRIGMERGEKRQKIEKRKQIQRRDRK